MMVSRNFVSIEKQLITKPGDTLIKIKRNVCLKTKFKALHWFLNSFESSTRSWQNNIKSTLNKEEESYNLCLAVMSDRYVMNCTFLNFETILIAAEKFKFQLIHLRQFQLIARTIHLKQWSHQFPRYFLRCIMFTVVSYTELCRKAGWIVVIATIKKLNPCSQQRRNSHKQTAYKFNWNTRHLTILLVQIYANGSCHAFRVQLFLKIYLEPYIASALSKLENEFSELPFSGTQIKPIF